jgi:hypothetical protein
MPVSPVGTEDSSNPVHTLSWPVAKTSFPSISRLTTLVWTDKGVKIESELMRTKCPYGRPSFRSVPTTHMRACTLLHGNRGSSCSKIIVYSSKKKLKNHARRANPKSLVCSCCGVGSIVLYLEEIVYVSGRLWNFKLRLLNFRASGACFDPVTVFLSIQCPLYVRIGGERRWN